MKDTKRRFELLSFYNHTGIETHFEKMAEKGWLIERLSNFGWTYRRIEPKKLKFTVTYYPQASEFDPNPSVGQMTFHDFCAHTGWQLACTWFQMQVFYNKNPDPIPIETEPAMEVANIHKACKANYLRSNWILLVISAVMGVLFLVSLVQTPTSMVGEPNLMVTGSIWNILAVYCGVELAVYYRWHSKAVKAAEQDIFLETPNTVGFQKCVMALVTILAVCWLASFLFSETPEMLPIGIAVLASIFGAQLLGERLKRWMRKKGVPTGVNRFITLLTVFLTVFLATGIITAVGVILKQAISY